jgi:phenylalanyl-tRNA synthetase alpha subunit
MFNKMLRKITEIENNFHNDFQNLITSKEVKNAQRKLVGKGGEVEQILKSFKDMLPEERRKIGEKVNQTVKKIEDCVDICLKKINQEVEVEEKEE